MYQNNQQLANNVDFNEIYANYQPYIPSPVSINSSSSINSSEDSLNGSSVYGSNESYNLWYNTYYNNYATPSSSSSAAAVAASYYYQNTMNYYNNYLQPQKSTPNSAYNNFPYNNSSSPDLSFTSSLLNKSCDITSFENINQCLSYSPAKDEIKVSFKFNLNIFLNQL